jgi:glucan phosphoethanolaminetransferase (alkaline phosphatase superfamily)
VNERAALTENVVRYGTAALVCFTIAVITYVLVAVTRMSSDTMQEVAALGVAWWLVGCGLVPLTAYWAWRRSLFDRSSSD